MTQHEAQEIAIELLKTMPLPDYSDDADKGDRGKLLVIAGSQRLPGTAILAARAALRVGCGTVRVAAPASVAVQIGIAVPELMVLPLPETSSGTIARSALPLLEAQYEVCRAAVIGPGLDEHSETCELVREVVAKTPLPLVVDAEALTAWSRGGKSTPYENVETAGARIFTPHSQEMSILTGRDESVIEAKREITALGFVRVRKATLVLKGRETLIASPAGELYRNKAGTRALGTAGSGDVLAGIIGGLLAQNMEATQAAVWGVHLHALAGEAVTEDMGEDGVMARDFLERLPFVMRYLRRQVMPRKDDRRPGLRRVS